MDSFHAAIALKNGFLTWLADCNEASVARLIELPASQGAGILYVSFLPVVLWHQGQHPLRVGSERSFEKRCDACAYVVIADDTAGPVPASEPANCMLAG